MDEDSTLKIGISISDRQEPDAAQGILPENVSEHFPVNGERETDKAPHCGGRWKTLKSTRQ